MSWETKTIYLWRPTGDRSCDVCLSMPKWSDDKPDRPHKYCDCEITMYVGFARAQYRNIVETEGGGTVQIERTVTEYENPGPKPMGWNKSVSVQVKKAIQVSIKAIGEKLGFSGSEEITTTISDSLSGEVPPGKRLVIEVTVEAVERIYSADKYYVFPVFDLNGSTEFWEEMDAGTVEGVRVIDEMGHVKFKPVYEDI